MVGRIVTGSLVLCLTALGVALSTGALEIPERYNPWAELSLTEEPHFLTRYKLSRLSKDRDLCQRVLAQSTFEYTSIPDETTGYACGFHNAVRMERTSVSIGEPFALSCRAAVSLALWERHVLQPAAQAHLGGAVTRLEHYGSYACRNVYGRTQATRSRHATAEALDVAGFVMENGERIRVLKDWDVEGARGTFLREVRNGACRFFDGVLTPDYNEAHADHFHLDRGPYRICR